VFTGRTNPTKIRREIHTKPVVGPGKPQAR
jgi:hypothetical protein